MLQYTHYYVYFVFVWFVCVAVSASLGRDSSLVAADHMFLIDLSHSRHTMIMNTSFP